MDKAPVAIDSIAMALRVLAETMPKLSAGQRRLVGPMLAELAITPESHTDINNALLGWLGAANDSSTDQAAVKSSISGRG